MPYANKVNQARAGRRWYLANKDTVLARKSERMKMRRFTARLLSETARKFCLYHADRERYGVRPTSLDELDIQISTARFWRRRLWLTQDTPVEVCVAVDLLQTLKQEMKCGSARTE